MTDELDGATTEDTMDEAEMTDGESPMEELRLANAELAARLRAELLRANPGIPAELVTGETLEEIEASFAAARDLAGRILRNAASAVPVGSPERTSAARMSARDLIRAGLAELPASAGGS